MNTPNSDPFDQTVWDPVDPEQAIEDPFHGPEARLTLLSTPPYPTKDGTYYVFGGYYVCGTTTFDSTGHPFIRIGSGASFLELQREALARMEWTDKWRAGELPPFEAMGYPVFQLDAVPYLVLDQVLDTPSRTASLGETATTGSVALDFFPIHPNPCASDEYEDHIQKARTFFKDHE